MVMLIISVWVQVAIQSLMQNAESLLDWIIHKYHLHHSRTFILQALDSIFTLRLHQAAHLLLIFQFTECYLQVGANRHQHGINQRLEQIGAPLVFKQVLNMMLLQLVQCQFHPLQLVGSGLILE